jgi:hypothetical protein
MLSEDDAFNSQPLLGNIAYRIPSVTDLFGMPKDSFDNYETLTFWIEVMAMHDLEPAHMKCQSTNNCKIVFRRQYTPIIHYISPPVIY